MEKFKGTAEKWRLEEVSNPNGSYFKVTTIGESICNITTRNRERAEANAKLIAAAPELLEALQQVLKEYDLGIVSGIDALKIKRLLSKATE